MLALKINDVKNFMNQLTDRPDTFDSFSLVEASDYYFQQLHN